MRNIIHLKSYFKFLSRNMAYTLIDVFGLSVSLMFVILIGVYTYQEWNIDKMHTKADRIYAFAISANGGVATGAHWGIQSKLKSRYPEIEETCAVANIRNITIKNAAGDRIMTNLFLVDSTFYDLFDFQLLRGDRKTALDAPEKIVISEDCARRFFGNQDPIGKSIQFNDSLSLTVSAVMAPMKNSCIQSANKRETDMILNFAVMKYFSSTLAEENTHMDNCGSTDIYILTHPGTNLPSKLDDMQAYLKTFFWPFQFADMHAKVELIPFNQLYFSNINGESGAHTLGDRKLVNVLFAVGLLILLFALLNYINLTVAQAGFRAKEMATRRLLGSSRTDIMVQLIAESTLLCLVSSVIGFAFAYSFAPYAGQLLSTKLLMDDAITPMSVAAAIAFILVVGFLAGIIPALVVSAAKPIEVVRGTFRRRTKMVFSKVIITFQNLITIVMIACALTMILQTHHLINAPLGYNKDNILVVLNPSYDFQKIDAFVNELHALPCVKIVSKAFGTPYDFGNNNTMTLHGRTISFQSFEGDENYMKIFGLTLKRDNHIADEDGDYLNSQALAELGLKEDAVSYEFYDRKPLIRGIVNDFHIGSIEEVQRPIRITIHKDFRYPTQYIIQVTGDPVKALENVKSAYKKVFTIDMPDETPYIDQQIQNSFDSEIRMSKIVSLFAFIAVIIALLGLLAMSTYFIQQRSREIAVRKVFGSTSREVLKRLVLTFLSYVLIAFVIAVPVIYYFMNNWLSGYSYRIVLSPWIYIVGGLFCLVISFATIFLQSYHAANANPVDSLNKN